MTDPVTEITPEFQRGWDAALMAARFWHESQAKKASGSGEAKRVFYQNNS